MKIVTAQEMRNIDKRAVKSFGIPGAVLMENAAAAVMAEMETFFNGLTGVKVGILCGKGNNGGDGLALARRLAIKGVAVRVALLSSFDAAAGEAKINLSILRKTDVEVRQNAGPRTVHDVISWSDIVVDALLGVGLSTPIRGGYASAVRMMNTAGKPVVAVDMPSGISTDTGEVMGIAVQADLTVTMSSLKRGLVLNPGASHAGAIRIADIGIPREVTELEHCGLSLLDENALWGMLGTRERDAHKGRFGHLLVIAGSPGKAGAAAMAAKSALRIGAGLVSVAAPNSIVPVIQHMTQESMCLSAAESIDNTIGIGAELELLKTSTIMQAVAIGPGLSTHYETVRMARNFIQRVEVPCVVDADGLNALVGSLDILKKSKAPLVLTPHPGEMARLIGVAPADVQKDRIGIAMRFAEKYRVTVVLKGAGTVIASPDCEAFVNSTGNPGMATGGTGDALTGMIAGLLAQGQQPLSAACLGVYLHGLAGDLAAAEKGETGMIAGDLIDKIPDAMLRIA